MKYRESLPKTSTVQSIRSAPHTRGRQFTALVVVCGMMCDSSSRDMLAQEALRRTGWANRTPCSKFPPLDDFSR